MMTFDEVVDTTKRIVRDGLREQIALDSAAIDKEWTKNNPNLDVILRLAAHIELCNQRLVA